MAASVSSSTSPMLTSSLTHSTNLNDALDKVIYEFIGRNPAFKIDSVQARIDENNKKWCSFGSNIWKDRVKKDNIKGIPLTYQLRRLAGGVITIHLYGPKETLLGKGTVLTSKQSYFITKYPDDQCKVERSVIQRSSKSKQNKTNAFFLRCAMISINVHQAMMALLKTIYPLEEILLPPEITHHNIYGTHERLDRLEIKQTRYLTDFEQALKKGIIGVRQSLNVIIDAATAIAQIHSIGYVHRDVKEKNILLSDEFKGSRRLKGITIDFDYSQQIGMSNTGEDFRAWDNCSTQKIVLPSTDIFGLATTAMMTLLPKMTLEFLQEWSKLHRTKNLEQASEDLNEANRNKFMIDYLNLSDDFSTRQAFLDWRNGVESPSTEEIATKLQELSPIIFQAITVWFRELKNSTRLYCIISGGGYRVKNGLIYDRAENHLNKEKWAEFVQEHKFTTAAMIKSEFEAMLAIENQRVKIIEDNLIKGIKPR